MNTIKAIANGEYWIYQGDGFDHIESLSCLVVIDPYELRKLIEDSKSIGSNKPGSCETCCYLSICGEYRTVECCDYDGDTDESLECHTTGNCPYWKTNSPLTYCKKHLRWYQNSWELACPDCFKEWESEQIKDYV